MDALNTSTSPVLNWLLVLIVWQLQLILVDHGIAIVMNWVVLLYVYMVALDHRNQNSVSLPQLRELFGSFDIRIIKRVFSFQVLEHLLIPDGEVLYFLTQSQDG